MVIITQRNTRMTMTKKTYTTPDVAIKELHMERLMGENSILTPKASDMPILQHGAGIGEGPTDFAKPNGGDIEWDL